MASRTTHSVRSRLGSGSWWFHGSDGRLVVGQYPNPALCVWIVATVVGWADLSTDHSTTVDGIAAGALIVWALDEAVRGASPFRRLLGLVVLVAQLTALLTG